MGEGGACFSTGKFTSFEFITSNPVIFLGELRSHKCFFLFPLLNEEKKRTARIFKKSQGS